MKKKLWCLLAWLAVILAGRLSAEEALSARIISVAGTAETKTAPDQVVWAITLSDFDTDMRKAKRSNDAKVTAVLDLRRDLDINDQDIETGQLSIRREHERGKYGERGAFRHYVVSRTVTIRQRDLSRFDEYLDELVASSEMEVGFSFESSRIHDIRAATRLKALAVAKEKAAAMAQAVGASLGRVLTIHERSPDQPFSSPLSNTSFTQGPPPVDVASDRFVPGAIRVQISVYTTFELQ